MSAASARHVMVVHNWYRSEQPSGEDRVVTQEVALLRGAGHRVSMFERRSDDIASMSLRDKVSVPLRVPWNRPVRTELERRLRAERPDVVHVHSTFPLLSPSVVDACRATATPVVATLHNYQLVCPVGSLYRDGATCTDCARGLPVPAVRHGCYRGSRVLSVPVALGTAVNRRRWLEGVDRFFCISAAQRATLTELGVPGDRLSVKYNFVDDPEAVRAGPGEHVLFVGRLTAEKGVGTLMAAWDRVPAAVRARLPLVVVGSGPMQDDVGRWAAGRSDVRVLGLQPPQRCAELTAQAATVLAPSVWQEAFGLVVVEAMAAGVPPVASATGALPELVDDGRTGLLHRPDDAADLAARIVDVLDPARNAAMGVAARERYDRDFSPAAGLAGLLAGYDAAIAHRGAGVALPAERLAR
jgi:glycosyltransferase involved in cell wall biosynthesis